MLAQDIVLEDLGGVAIQFEHAGIERQHVFGRDIGRRRGSLACDRRHVRWKGLSVAERVATAQQYRDCQARVALHVHSP
jgi:hypothetical protein